MDFAVGSAVFVGRSLMGRGVFVGRSLMGRGVFVGRSLMGRGVFVGRSRVGRSRVGRSLLVGPALLIVGLAASGTASASDAAKAQAAATQATATGAVPTSAVATSAAMTSATAAATGVAVAAGVAASGVLPAGQVTDAPVAAPGGAAPVTFTPGGPAAAAEAAQDKPDSEKKSKDDVIENRFPRGLSISIGGTMNFGSSTFVLNSGYTRDPLVTWSTSFSPSYSFADSTRISASVALSQELTKADGDDNPQTLLLSDVSLGASRPIYNFQHGPKLSGSLNLTLPASTASRTDSLVTALGARVNAAQKVGKFGLSLGTGVRKNFHRYTHPVRDPNTGHGFVTQDGLVVDDVVTGISRNGGSELSGNTYFEGEANNTSVIWASSLGASYPVTDRISLGISYGLAMSWTYESYPIDQFSSPYARGGPGRGESQTGSLSASYEATDRLSFGLGMVTGGGLLSADEKRYRFPFYAFEGAESNLTTFFVSATYTESIPL